MKRLFYLLAIVLFTSTFMACSTTDELAEISIKTPESELSEENKKDSKPVPNTHQPGREEVKPKSPF